MNTTGYCQIKPRNFRYLYIDNVRDHISYILKFIKECTGIEYTFGIYRSEILNCDTDCYSFFNTEDTITILFYLDDNNNYIIFDKDHNQFEIYSVDGFNDSFR
ncbi:hypothetical protein EOM09_07645, partial [bacterium]|nr:hypothetical protein [bacterium]